MRIFQLQGFELTDGQLVARLRLTDEEPPRGQVRRSALWSRIEEGRNELGSALAMKANRQALLTIGGVPHDSKVQWAVREVGSSGAMDLVALIQRSSGGHALLMVDCMSMQASPARLREQVAQSVRIALSTLAKVSLADRPSWIKLVVLSGWRRGVPVPTEAKPLPALQREPAVLESVPEPAVWGYVPYHLEQGEQIYVALGLWEEFDDEPWSAMSDDVVPLPWPSWAPKPVSGWGDGAVVEVEQHQQAVRVSLRLRSSAHKASMKKDRHGSPVANRVRALRAACYSGHMAFGAGRFVGETIEDGVPRLHWDWAAGQAPGPEAAQELVVQKLEGFGKPGQSGMA